MRKRLTQIMPFLIPIRKWQRNFVYFLKMRFDKNHYCKTFNDDLFPFEVCNVKSLLINENSGYDIQYQINKVDNLKITSKTMNKVIIYPGETFSFNLLAKKYKKYGKYKKGLVLINNEIVPTKGGGICGLSNLLYEAFLQTPLTIVERHGHNVKSLPNPDKDTLEGVDATVSTGWKDLKVRNDTEDDYQLNIHFDDKYMYIEIFSDKDSNVKMNIINENFKYLRKNDKIYESVEVIKEYKDKNTDELIKKEKLYDEVVEVTYELPEETKIEDVENE